jgi:hypothetical protein
LEEVHSVVIGVLIGVLIGILIGIAVGPSIRSWISWREYVDASREARLHEEVLRLMSSSDDDPSSDRSRPVTG